MLQEPGIFAPLGTLKDLAVEGGLLYAAAYIPGQGDRLRVIEACDYRHMTEAAAYALPVDKLLAAQGILYVSGGLGTLSMEDTRQLSTEKAF